MRRFAGLVAGVILLTSAFIPMAVVFGRETVMGSLPSSFYIFEFPFMKYYLVFAPLTTSSGWEVYEFAPRYLGLVLLIMGGTFCDRREPQAIVRKPSGVGRCLGYTRPHILHGLRLREHQNPLASHPKLHHNPRRGVHDPSVLGSGVSFIPKTSNSEAHSRDVSRSMWRYGLPRLQRLSVLWR